MWNDLSMRDRALLIRLAVSLGITNLDDILQSYNQLATGGPKDNKDIKQWVLDDMARRIEAVENDKSNKEGGWNARKGVWEPHTSVEGGANTIHYGIKLVPANKEIVDLVKKQGYITNDLGWDYLKRTRLSNDYDTARRTFNTYNKDALAWDSLSPKMLSILTDYQFNVGNGGLSVFKNLMNAAYNNDLEGLNREYKRYTGGLELTRNKHIKNELDSILNGFYNIMTEKPIEEDNSDVSDVYTDGKLMEYVKAMEESNSKTLPMTTPYNDGNIGEFVKSLPYYKGIPMTTPYNDGWFPGKKADGGKIDNLSVDDPKNNISDGQYYDIMEKVAEQNYKDWGYNNPDEALVHILNDNVYNYRGYYNEFPNGDGNALDHWPDKYKTAYHPTFSDLSTYSGKVSEYNPTGRKGGHWLENNYDFFIPSVSWNNKFAKGGPEEKDKSLADNIRERLYYNITPRGYENAIPRLFDAALDKRERRTDSPNLEALWAKYLGLNDEDFRSMYKDFPDDKVIQYPLYPRISDYVQESKYTPSDSKDKDAKYYSLAFPEISNLEIDQFLTSPDKRRQTQGYNDTMGTFTLTKGRDDKGDYISYYDKWDVSPFRGYGAKHDESLGIGKPVELYDRLYLDDYYNNPQSPADYWSKGDYYGGYLPEVIVTASGEPADEGLRGRVPTPDNIGLGTFGRHNPVNRFDGTSQPSQQMDRGNQPLYDGQIGFGFGYNPETFERYYTGFYNPYNNSYNNATWVDENDEYNIGLPTVTIRPSGESMVNRAQEKAAPVVRDVLLGSAALAGGIPALANAASKVPLSALKPGGAFWTNPLTQQMAAGTLAAEGVNAGIKAITPYNSVGEGIGSTIESVTGWNPNNTWLGPIVTEAFNPGWYVSPTGMINTASKIGGITELTLKDAINNTNLTKYKRLIFGNKHLPNIFKRMLGFPNEHLAPYENGSAYNLNEYLSYLNYIKQKDIDILDKFFTEPKKGINLSKVTPPYLAWGNAHPNDPKMLIRFTEGPFIGKPSIHKPGNWSSTNEPISLKIGDTPISGNMEIMKYTPGEVVHPISIAKNHSGFSRTIPFAGEYVPNGILENLPGPSVEIPIKNDDLFNQVLLDYIAQLEQKGYPVVGSTRTIAEGYHGGVPGDTEILVPKTMLDDAIEKFGFQKSRNTAGNTGITGHSDSAFVGKDGNAENLDINILDDTGPIIHEIESTRRPDVMPSLYDANARANAASGRLESTIIKSSDLKIPKEDGTFYTAKEYLDEIKNDKNLITQNVIDNIFKSNKEKHFKRAFTMMNSEDPRIITKVSTAIDHMVSQIPGMKRFSNLYKSQSFDNVEKNKEILEKIGFKPFDVDKFASNPELMKNIVDYWYMRKTVGTRSVNYSNKGGARENASLDEVMQAVRSFDNGSSAGGGGNEILGNKFGGYTRDYTSYNYHDPMLDKKTATFDDVFNYFERERNVWNDKDVISNALTLSFKELGIKLPDNININFMNSNFTDIITDMIASGKITAKQGDNIIKRVSEKLGVSGYRGTSYGHNSEYGDYYGAMQRVGLSGENSNPLSTLRNIDSGTHNLPLAPAEWGTDNMFKIEDDGFKTRWNNIITKPLVVRDEFPKLTVEEAKKLYGSEGITDISDFYVYDSSGHVDALRTFDKYMTERKKILNDVKDRNDQLIKRKKDIAEKNAKSYDAHRRATNRLVSAKAFGTALGGFGGFALLLNTLYNNNLKKEAQYYMEEFPNIYPVLLKEGTSKYPNNKEKAIKWAIRKINKTPESKLEEFVENKNELGNGGKIYIKPSKRGTFTAAAKKYGKSVQAFASLVLANPSNYSPAMRKKANFARNAAKWH